MVAWLLAAMLLLPSSPERKMLVGQELEVVVASLDGEPISGTVVELFFCGDVKGMRDDACLTQREAFSATDDRGGASLRLTRPGYYVLRSSLEGFVPMQLGPFLIDSFERPRNSVRVPLELRMNESVQH